MCLRTFPVSTGSWGIWHKECLNPLKNQTSNCLQGSDKVEGRDWCKDINHHSGVFGSSSFLWNLPSTILFYPVTKFWDSMTPLKCKYVTCSLLGRHLANHHSILEREVCSSMLTGQERFPKSHSMWEQWDSDVYLLLCSLTSAAGRS